MASQYLISRRWSLGTQFTVTDAEGVPKFEVSGKFALGRKLSVADPGGTELAVISRQGLARSFQIRAGGQETTVRPRGFLGRRFEIDSPAGPLEAHGNFSGREYVIASGGTPAASVTQLRALRERFAVDVADGQDPVLMLAVVLVIETIRDDRRRAAAS
ncbi:MAG TPA: hypothetical protein VGG75_32900 [Trebonia sp.]|jgi:uncharacterized protein YxjI